MKYIVDKEGFLLKEDGERLVIDGEPVEAKDFMDKDQINSKIQERLARQKKEFEATIKTLEEQANKTPQLTELLNETKTKMEAVEKELQKAEETAQNKVSVQMKNLEEKNKKAESELITTKKLLMQQEVVNQLMPLSTNPSTGTPLFVNIQQDVVPRMLNAHKREPARDEDGKVIDGVFVDVFEVDVYDSKTETYSKKLLPANEAVSAFASNPNNRHYLMGNAAGGSPRIKSLSGGVDDKTPKFGVDKIRQGLEKGILKT